MKKQTSKPRKLKVYMVVLSIMLISVLFLTIKVYAYNENLYWRGGSGVISNQSHWFILPNSPCGCIPKVTTDSINTVYFDSNSGSGTVTLDINISSGPVHISSNTNIIISILNNTKWTIYGFGPSLIPPINPPFNVIQVLTSAFYLLAFITICVLFIIGAFWVRRVRGKIG